MSSENGGPKNGDTGSPFSMEFGDTSVHVMDHVTKNAHSFCRLEIPNMVVLDL